MLPRPAAPTATPRPAAPQPGPPRGTRAALSYLVPGGVRPRSYTFAPPPGEPWESGRFEAREVAIADGRQYAGLSVHREGFALWDAPSALRDFEDEDTVRATGYAEAAELACAATGAAQAHVFDHLLRRREPGRPALGFGRASGGRAAANGRIHNDYTEASGRRRLELVLPDAARRRTVGRWAIVNIWRPLRGPVLDAPLALCDARTVDDRDLIEAEVRYPHRTGEIYFLAHAPQHRWSWFPAMQPHEALVFKQFDSHWDTARFTPHAAFEHPDTPADAPLRESMEMRCLLLWP